MKTILVFFMSFLVCSTFAAEHHASKMADQVKIDNAWARATFALAKSGAAYMTINNISAKELRLVSVSVSESVANDAQLHHTIMKDDVMSMQELDDGVVVDASSGVEFLPGGKHIMLLGLTGPLLAGESLVLTFTFEDESILNHTFAIKDATNAPKSMSH
ncbi:copper chaperone PCu(A)C [Glaciecola petra]|uniref:Copper chaperone PCu(A)C n=1 Tax=Glaciecola petra TaxID=3075602 RepID=A0ABU2ZRX1_9ALTE|nr:copper chaperone PCu(A)C [Aestuariibacter sp. P117]MDT0595383.1 copper chaperone PCu(A)C [Aestuariibacter sp. P117]